MTCGKIPEWGDRTQASHVGVSNFKIKPPDNQAVPQCGACHYIFEYHKGIFEAKTGQPAPTLDDCARYFALYSRTQDDPETASE